VPDIANVPVWKARAKAFEATNGIPVIIDTASFFDIGKEILTQSSQTNSSIYDGEVIHT
jgi:hypothetical protein